LPVQAAAELTLVALPKDTAVLLVNPSGRRNYAGISGLTSRANP
jgi:hypothetical protein